MSRYGVAGEVGQAKGEDGDQQHLNQILADDGRFSDTNGQEHADFVNTCLCPKGQYQGQNDGADNDNHHQKGHDQFIQRSQRSGGVFVSFIVHLHSKGFPVDTRQGLDFGYDPRHVLRVVYGDMERGKSIVDFFAVKLFRGLQIHKHSVLDFVIGGDSFPKLFHRMRGKQSNNLYPDFRPGKALIFHAVTVGGEIIPDLQLVSFRQVLADDCHMGIVSGNMPSLCQRQCAGGEKFIIFRVADAQGLCISLIFCVG